MTRIAGLTALDMRFPTSRTLAGSDAMHSAPDYSAAYVVLHTDSRDRLEGHGLTFTIGRGNEVCVAAVIALAPLVVGRTLESIVGDMSGFCQLDCCRLGGLNEVLAVLLMAAKFGVPVCPHAGGVGLCEYEQHVSLFDYIAVSGSLEDRVLAYVEHLHEHFVDPVAIRDGRYVAPKAPGWSITMRPESLVEFEYPTGQAWRTA